MRLRLKVVFRNKEKIKFIDQSICLSLTSHFTTIFHENRAIISPLKSQTLMPSEFLSKNGVNVILTNIVGAVEGPYILTNMRKTLKLFSNTSSCREATKIKKQLDKLNGTM